jgi:GTP-binding protein
VNLNNVEFIRSVAEGAYGSGKGFIRDRLPQIVFAGRSNVGKSSVINRLLNRKNMARTGSVPGKTAHINYFLIDGACYFVDLPGYGYARVSAEEKRRWATLMESYFGEPELITAGVLIVDIRHAPSPEDRTMADWFRKAGRPFIAAANKADKVQAGELNNNLALISRTLGLPDDNPPIPFSAQKGTGREELLGRIKAFIKNV